MSRRPKSKHDPTPSERRQAWVKDLRDSGGAILNVYLEKEANDRLIALMQRHEMALSKKEVITQLIMKADWRDLETGPDRELWTEADRARRARLKRRVGKRGGRRRRFEEGPKEDDKK